MDAFITSVREGQLSILESFWEHSEDNMFIVSLDEENDFFLEHINPAQKRALQIESHHFNGAKLKHLLEKTDCKRIESIYRNCLEKNQPLTYHETAVSNNKTSYWNTMIIPIMESDDGKIRIVGISREMTELINTKNALDTLNAELEQNILARTQALETLKKQLEIQAYTDVLTRVGNRRYFFQQAEALFQKAQQSRQPVSLLYLDIDNFKALNDLYGHLSGDDVLQEFAFRLKTRSRHTDVLARFGGEEFVVLLPDTDKQTAVGQAENILTAIAHIPFISDGNILSVTTSIGVSTMIPDNKETIKTLIKRADQALYTAKKEGKNRVALVEDS